MFNLFKKKEESIKLIDKIWMTEAAKFQSMIDEWKKDNTIAFIFWFDDSLRMAESFLSKETIEPIPLLTIRESSTATIAGKKIVFAEHHPLQQKEHELFEKLNLTKAEIWSALDEPLFKHFGGEKIVQLMKQLGMKENEAVENKMLTKAVQNAQAKIEKKVLAEQFSTSQKDWIEKNLHP